MRTISKSTSTPQFPFFSDLSAYINNIVQQNFDELNKSVSILQENQDNEPQEITTGMSSLCNMQCEMHAPL